MATLLCDPHASGRRDVREGNLAVKCLCDPHASGGVACGMHSFSCLPCWCQMPAVAAHDETWADDRLRRQVGGFSAVCATGESGADD